MLNNLTDRKRIVSFALAVMLAITAVVSAAWAAPEYSNPDNRAEAIEYLDSKRDTVLALTTASTTASTALTLLKDDWATPIANELAELSVYFMIILAAIVLEKYLLTLSGLLVFRYIIPVACVLLIVYIFRRDMAWTKTLAVKLAAFGMAFFLLIPASIEVCQIIEETHNISIQQALESAENATVLAESETGGEKNFWSKIFSGIEETVSGAINSVKNILNNFIEAVAIMLITSCAIPILILCIFVWIIKAVSGLEFSASMHRYKGIPGVKNTALPEDKM